jgi:hypothetical protein
MLTTTIQCKKCKYKDIKKSVISIRITENNVFMQITNSLSLNLNNATYESQGNEYLILIPECIYCP